MSELDVRRVEEKLDRVIADLGDLKVAVGKLQVREEVHRGLPKRIMSLERWRSGVTGYTAGIAAIVSGFVALLIAVLRI